MKIDSHPVEMEAMAAFRKGDGKKGHELQDKFLEEFYESLKRGEDFCPCPEKCRHRGNCRDCVIIHRAHGDHLPYCMHDMLNQRLKKLSELSEHSIAENIK